VACSEAVDVGTVMVIDQGGALRQVDMLMTSVSQALSLAVVT